MTTYDIIGALKHKMLALLHKFRVIGAGIFVLVEIKPNNFTEVNEMKVINCMFPKKITITVPYTMPEWYKTPNVQIEDMRALLQTNSIFKPNSSQNSSPLFLGNPFSNRLIPIKNIGCLALNMKCCISDNEVVCAIVDNR